MVTSECGWGFIVLEQGGAEVGGEIVDVVEPDGVVHGVAGGADAYGGVRVFHGLLGEDGDHVGHEGLELPAGEVESLLVELGELLTEGWVIEPAPEGTLRNAGIAGGLGDGG